MARRKPIAQRIYEAFGPDEPYLDYHALMSRVFPRDEYPNAYRYSSNGGPPGCAMTFRKALNRLGMVEHYQNYGDYHGYFFRPANPARPQEPE
jgi:hypothetical protein